MSRLTDLLRAAKQLDPQLGEDLEAEIRPLQERLPFGLNFERHAPEAVELAGHKVRKGSKVRVLPPRGSTIVGDSRIWTVRSLNGESVEIATPNGQDVEQASVALDDLVLVAEFRDRIYPGLQPDGTVQRGVDKPFQTVINGENFHVLEQLTFTHEHSVDAIYIDPPYNSGARDWKYNNDYVEGDDLYRHSKWLAFMERRLKLARRLLKQDDSVLIVTIDEKEYLRLGLLLEQVFPNASIQMITSVINPKGNPRRDQFSRCDEYIYFVKLGDAEHSPWSTNMLAGVPNQEKDSSVRWKGLLRSASNGRRVARPNLFYPLYFSSEDGKFLRAGERIPIDQDRSSVLPVEGETIMWPIGNGGRELTWSLEPESFRSALEKGYIRFGKFTEDGRVPYYLTSGQIQSIESKNGKLVVTGYDGDGAVKIEYGDGGRTTQPMTVWNMVSHSATEHGAGLTQRLLPGRSFPFPKSLYAVEDTLRFFVKEKPDAVVLDFFAGSGTTAHAVMRLNKQDGGRRQCISVTNNEVSSDEQVKLRKAHLRPGDSDWERLGICEYVTKPRIRAAITGATPSDEPIQIDYKFVDQFSMSEGFDENAAFFTLTYESPWRVNTDRAFAAIAPMLWLRAGAVGRRLDSISDGWEVADSYGIINDLDQSSEFIAALEAVKGVQIAYIVTDDEGRYQQIANEIPGIETVRLYEDYLRNCESVGDF